MFDRKEDAEKRAMEAKRKELEKVRKMSEIQIPTASSPRSERLIPKPKDYREFMKEIKQRPQGIYEKLCAISEKFPGIEPPTEMKRSLQDSIGAAFIYATPKGAFSAALLIGVSLILLTSLLMYVGIGLTMGMVLVLLSVLTGWYTYNYPSSVANSLTLRMSADSVLAILYMVLYMRNSPNLEGAIRFAAQNLKGPLAWDLKKLLWDIELGKYPSANAAVLSYVEKWKEKNREFAEALNLLRQTDVGVARKAALFDETINVILDGTKERAKHFAEGLRMPMMAINALGILLPIIGLVMFPVVIIFMSSVAKPIFLFVGYDILLPLMLIFLVNHTLKTKPPTFSQPDITEARGVSPLGYIKIRERLLPVWPFAVAIGLVFSIVSLLMTSSSDLFTSVNGSVLGIMGLAFAIVIYAYLDSYQKAKLRADIERIEDEFSVALFELGNLLASGVPIELAVDKVRANVKNLKVAELFEITSMNMKKFGYTFEEAMFNKDVGAIWYYPSKLIRSIMQVVVQSSKKSVASASDSMLVVSRYLKGVHDVKEEINDILSETLASMKFLAMILAPLVGGITVTMAVVILQILGNIGTRIASIVQQGGSMSTIQLGLLGGFGLGGGAPPITATAFQFIIGIYMIEISLLLSIFINRVQYGDDAIGERLSVSRTLLIGIFIYAISWYITFGLFGGTVQALLTPTGG
ncbi:MAG TPA: hypothetical protein VJH90_02655 [archaeon]|nr:hypothetical protein [archaeon]